MRPGYRELAPPPALRHALDCLWVRAVAPGEDAAVRILPDACSDLVWRAGRGAWLAAPDTGPALAQMVPGAVIVGVRFAPGAGGPALRLALDEVRDMRVDLRELMRSADRRLHGGLEPAEALRRLAALAEELVGERPPDPSMREAVRVLGRPGARVEALAGELGLSERQLLRRSRAAVGYGPKLLQRVLRFRRALRGLDAGGAGDLARVAADAGYADQAHFSRDCARLSGLSPAALARERARRA
jgi:AraC-like DNA-binding protein